MASFQDTIVGLSFDLTLKKSAITFEASEDDGDVLVFKDAVLARAEANKNGDYIDDQGITDIARTIAGKAIDIEHDPMANCGVFTRGRNVGGALMVDGVIWADRYGDIAAGVKSGEQQLSVEATADLAACTMCGGQFSGADQYCEHLRSRVAGGARRKLTGLKGKGGAVTKRPAGTNTAFDRNQIFMVASHAEEGSLGPKGGTLPVSANTNIEIKESAMDDEKKEGEKGNPFAKKEENAEAAGVSPMQAEMDKMTAEMAGLTAKLEAAQKTIADLQASLTASEQRVTSMVTASRKEQLSKFVSENDLAASMTIADRLDEAGFTTYLSTLAAVSAKTPEMKQPAGLRLDAAETAPARKPLTL